MGYWDDLAARTVRLCGNCGLPVTQAGASAGRSPTGWAHDRFGGWAGVRCPGRLTGAVPGSKTTTVGAVWAAWPKETA